MRAPTVLGDALRDWADLCDLHPEWKNFAGMASNDNGIRLNFQGYTNDDPVAVARALLEAVRIYAETPESERETI